MKNIKVKFVVAISLLFFFATVVTSPCNGENKEKDFIYPQIHLGQWFVIKSYSV